MTTPVGLLLTHGAGGEMRQLNGAADAGGQLNRQFVAHRGDHADWRRDRKEERVATKLRWCEESAKQGRRKYRCQLGNQRAAAQHADRL